MTCEITTKPLSLARVGRRLDDPGCGGVVLFVGRVRQDADLGRRITALFYETHRAMVMERLEALEKAARRRFDVRRVYIVHRVGLIRVGAASVLIGVAAPHRATAFRAARFLIEELKREVPIWKSDRWGRAPTGRRPRTRPRPPGARSQG